MHKILPKKQKIKILNVLHTAKLGGTERHVLLNSEYMNRDLFHFSVLMFEHGDMEKLLQDLGIDVFVIERKSRLSVIHLYKIAWLILKNKIDIIHTHTSTSSRLIGQLLGKKTIETRHGIGLTDEEYLALSTKKIIYEKCKERLAHYIITVSQYDREKLINAFHYKPGKVHVIYNGVSVETIRELSQTNPGDASKYFKTTNSFILGCVSRLSPQKGLSYLIEALPAVIQKHQNVQLVIVGDGEERNSLKHRVNSLGMNDHVVFTGYINNSFYILSKFDIFLSPSLWEGIPYSIMEAMALGKPVITTRIMGMPEIVEDGINGYLVETRNPDMLSQKIIELIENPDLRHNMGKQSLEIVKNKFHILHSVRRIEELYIEALAKSKP